MGGKVTASRKKGTVRRSAPKSAVRTAGRTDDKEIRPRSRSAAMRLAAEVDALQAELQAAQAKILELEARVDEDALTGLLNRRGFERALERSLAYVRRYGTGAALLYLDLDGFKPVNDRHGHAAGDWALVRVARLIAEQVRASDIVGRLGGDEFAVLLWNVDAAQALDKSRALEKCIEHKGFERDRARFTLGMSVGFATLLGRDTVEGAIARADTAMYARKRARKLAEKR